MSLAALDRRMQAMIAVRLRAGARHRLHEFTDQIGALPEVCNPFFLGVPTISSSTSPSGTPLLYAASSSIVLREP